MSMAEDTRSRADEHSERPRPETGGRESDPLAELARLIGQSDPFAELKRKPLDRAADDAPPGWLARGPASAYDAYQTAEPVLDPRRPADANHGSAADQARAAGEPHDAGTDARYDVPDYDERYRVAMPSAEPDYYGDEMSDEGYVPPPRRPAWLIPVAAVLGLAVVGTAGAFGYRALTGPSSPAAAPPVIKADTTPAKVAPAAQPADAQPKIFDRVGETPASERVVSREEQPVDINTRPRPVTPPPTMAAPPTVPSFSTAPTAAAPPANANEPKRVRTTVIRPVPTDPAAQLPGATPGAPTARTPLASPPPRTAPTTKSGPLALNPQSAETSAPPVRTARVAPSDGSYVVQVSAQKTESDAQASYRALQAKYPDVLGGREASIRRADLGDKGVYYRAHVGPFATANQAATFCENLKAAGGQCIVQRN
jgi:sporulation related protein